MVRNYVDNGLKRDKAIEIAIKEYIKEDILREFLVRHSGEVYNMIFQEFNLETAIKVAKREAAEDALKLGEASGIAKGEAMGIAKGEAIVRVAGRAEGEVVGIEKGIHKLSQTLIDLNIPQDVREKKLYEAYPDEKELVRSMIHEESVKYR